MASARAATLLAILVAASLAGCVSKEPVGGAETPADPQDPLLAPLFLSNDTYTRQGSWGLLVAAPVPMERVRPHVPDALTLVENAPRVLPPQFPALAAARDLVAPRTWLWMELLVGRVETTKGSGEGASLRAYVAVEAPEHLAAADRVTYHMIASWTNVAPEAALARQWLFSQTQTTTSFSHERTGGAAAGWQVSAEVATAEGPVAALSGVFLQPSTHAAEQRRFANPYWDTSFFLDEAAVAGEDGLAGRLVVDPGDGGLLSALVTPEDGLLFDGVAFSGGGSDGTYGFVVNPNGPLADQTDWGAGH